MKTLVSHNTYYSNLNNMYSTFAVRVYIRSTLVDV